MGFGDANQWSVVGERRADGRAASPGDHGEPTTENRAPRTDYRPTETVLFWHLVGGRAGLVWFESASLVCDFSGSLAVWTPPAA
jgi:hypothetical protein